MSRAYVAREYRDDIGSGRMTGCVRKGDEEDNSSIDDQLMHMSTSSTSPTKYSTFDIFNDLTYSDDEVSEDGRLTSLDGVEKPLYFQDIPQQKPQHLIHPLARSQSNGLQTDDESSLQYSISTALLDDQSRASSYGSVNAVVFRPSTPFFDSPERQQERSPKRQQLSHHLPLPPQKRQAENSHLHRFNKENNKTKSFTQTPISLYANSESSPATSVTVNTDDSISPASDITNEKHRFALAMSAEEKRRRRGMRLKRIRQAAKARDAAVQTVRGKQQKSCNNTLFAFLFICQFLLVSMAAMAFHDRLTGVLTNQDEADHNPFAGLESDDVIVTGMYKPKSYGGDGVDLAGGDGSERSSYIDYVNVIQLVCIASGYASFSSIFALGFMMMLSGNLLYAIFVFTIVVCLMWAAIGLALSQSFFLPAIGIIALTSSASYTWFVWDRIPFAATNLSVALKGMRETLDIPLIGVCNLMVTFAWTMCWIYAFFGASDYLWNEQDLSDTWMVVVVVFFFFSYYWTIQVIKGVSQATVAAIIGHWWYVTDEEKLPICSGILYSALLSRTLSKCFGSICLGSLVLCPSFLVSRFWAFLRLAKPKIGHLMNPESSLSDSQKPDDTTIGFDDDIVSRNVNQWSYAYIGLYGYSFWDAGSKASELFQARGWTHVVSDHLILSAIYMSTVIIGASTGCLGVIASEVDGYSFSHSVQKPLTSAFLISLFVGYFLSSAFLSIIKGSVSAILVCYAVAPVDFHANHPLLSKEMKTGWKHFWLQKK